MVWGLLNTNLISKFIYTECLSIVLVKKSLDKWRMCFDYTGLNKACLKDLYQLPNIDRLLDIPQDTSFYPSWRYIMAIIISLCMSQIEENCIHD